MRNEWNSRPSVWDNKLKDEARNANMYTSTTRDRVPDPHDLPTRVKEYIDGLDSGFYF